MIDKNTIYSYFQTDDFPTEDQFRATWDSFWHKSESIPMSQITGLNQLFQQTATVAQLNDKANVDGSNIDVSAYQEGLKINNLAETVVKDLILKVNSPEDFVASDVIMKIDVFTKEIISYKQTEFFIDGSFMNDDKLDNVIYIKREGKYYFRQFDIINIKWFGASGNGENDDTYAFKKAFDFLSKSKFLSLKIPAGVYLITETLEIKSEFNIVGEGAFKQIMPGGLEKENSSIIRWAGEDNSSILILNNVSGIEVKNICFDSGSGAVLNYDNLTGIQLINESVTRHNIVKNCYFNLLNKGIEFFDSGNNPTSNTNMDSNSIQNCIFYYCEIGICIDQLNVYNCDIYYCSFYGNYSHTKHHLLIKQGHADIVGGYLGILKNENSVGGRNGVAIDISNGFCNVTNVYGECHNGEFFVWRSSNPAEPSVSSISNCIINADSSKFPNDYQILNETGNILNVFGGHFSGKFCQKNPSNGYIIAENCFSPQISSLSKNGAVILKGIVNGYKSNGDEVRSIAALPKIAMLNQTSGKDFQFLWSDSDILTLTVPGYYGGIQFDFSNKKIYMADWEIIQ